MDVIIYFIIAALIAGAVSGFLIVLWDISGDLKKGRRELRKIRKLLEKKNS